VLNKFFLRMKIDASVIPTQRAMAV